MAPPLSGRRVTVLDLAACVVSGAIGATGAIGKPGPTLCSMSTVEMMCGARVGTGRGDTALVRCAVSRAALSATSAVDSPTGEESSSERSSAGWCEQELRLAKLNTTARRRCDA